MEWDKDFVNKVIQSGRRFWRKPSAIKKYYFIWQKGKKKVKQKQPMSKKLVYIAGKLRNKDPIEYLKNVRSMIKWSMKIYRLGYAPFVPCLDILSIIVDGKLTVDDVFSISMEMLKRSDYIFVCPNSENSEGVRREIEVADKLKIPRLEL